MKNPTPLLYVSFDQIWVWEVSGARQTGLYSVAVTIAMQLMILPMSIQEVLYYRIMQVDTEEDAATVIAVWPILSLAAAMETLR